MADVYTGRARRDISFRERIFNDPFLDLAEVNLEPLQEIYDLIIEVLQTDDFVEELREKLTKTHSDYMKKLKSYKDDLSKTDCGIVVVGETSSGKSTLINHMIGKKIFKPRHFASTSVICRIRNFESMKIVLCDKDGNLLVPEIIIEGENIDDLRKQLDPYIVRQNLHKELENLYYVDVFLPLTNLKGNIMIVDTPGIGESDQHTQILMDYIPNAVSLIFVLDVSRAGGMQEDRMKKLMKMVAESKDNMPCFDASEVIFLTNKWDCIKVDDDEDYEKSLKEIKDIQKEKIIDAWPFATEDKIFYTSLTELSTLLYSRGDKHGNGFEDFQKMIPQTIRKNTNKRIKMHVSFLQFLLVDAEREIQIRLSLYEKTAKERRSLIVKHASSLQKLERKCQEIKEGLHEKVSETSSELIDLTFSFFSSTMGSNFVLNPRGKTPITEISLFLEKEIIERINLGLISWMLKNELFKAIVDKLEDCIASIFYNIQMELKIIDGDLKGKPSSMAVYDAPVAMLEDALPHPIVKVPFAAFLLINCMTSTLSASSNASIRMQRERKVELYYQTLLTRENIEKVILELMDNVFTRKIDRLFGEYLPNRIRNMALPLGLAKEDYQNKVMLYNSLKIVDEKLTGIHLRLTDIHSDYKKEN